MASISLADLLHYKDEVEITDPRTGKVVAKVWMRVLGDLDLTRAYKSARIASAAKREALRNPETEDYKDEVLGVTELSRDEKIELIKTAKLTSIMAEATIAVVRPELPELEEVAVQPDAPSLEELEKHDRREIEVEQEYQKQLDDYVKSKTDVMEAELKELSDDELLKEAQAQVSNLVPFAMFLDELNAWKVVLGTYEERECKTRVFSSTEDFKQLPKITQQILVAKMNSLEVDGPAAKN